MAAAAAVVGSALLAAFGVVLYSTLLAPEPPAIPLAELKPGLLARTPEGTRVDPRVDFEAVEHAKVEWTGYLRVPLDGRYMFSVAGPARLEIAGRPVNGAADLRAGHHALRLSYARAEGRPECRLFWESDARPKEVVPDHSLFHVGESPSARN